MPESAGIPWYETGTVKVTNGSTAVVGTGTNWANYGLKAGDIFTTDRSVLYEIASVNSNTSITLKQAYSGTSGSTLNYYIIRNFAATLQAEIAYQVSDMVGKYESWKDGELKTIGIPFNFSSLYKGTWATGREYKALDIVLHGTAMYVCAVAHTSASGTTPGTSGAATYWLSYAPAVPERIEVLSYNNAGTLNSLYRGKNLGTAPTAAQYAAIQNGSFAGMQCGDYWTRQITYTYTDPDDGDAIKTATITPVMRIGGANYLYRSGDTDLTRNGLTIVPDANLFTAPMNPTNTTEGAYALCRMREKYLARALAIFEAFFGADHVLSYRGYLQNAVTNGKPTAGAWYDCKVELMSEAMVYGTFAFNSGVPDGTNVPNRYTVLCKQLPLFQHRPDMISNRQWYWLTDVVSAASFASVDNRGDCAYHPAGSVNGVRPAALIG